MNAPNWATGIPALPSVNTDPTPPSTATPFSLKQVEAWVAFFLESFVAHVAIALGGISILGWDPLSFLTTWGQNLETQASNAYSTAIGAQSTATNAQSTANTAQTTATTTQTNLGNLLVALVNGFGNSVEHAVVSDVEGAIHDANLTLQALEQVTGKAWTGLQQTAGQITTAVEADGNTLWHDLESMAADVGGAIGNLIDQLTNAAAGGGTSTGNKALQSAQQLLQLALTTQANQQATIALQNQQSTTAGGSSASGLDVSLTFTGADGTLLSTTDWQAAQPAAGDVCVRTSNNTPCMGIAAGLPAGLYLAPANYTFSTDNQAVECVLGSNSSSGSALNTYLLFHCNTTFTAGAYVAMENNALIFGRFTQSGGVYTFTPIGSPITNITVVSSNRVQISNTGNVYTISLNGFAHPSITDTGNTISQGASYRSAGTLMQRASVIWNPGPWQYYKLTDSFQVAGVLLADYIAPTYSGTGFRVEMASAASAHSLSNGTNLAQWMTSIDVINDPNSWSTTTGYTIPTSGFWVFQLMVDKLTSSGSGSTWTEYQGALARNGNTTLWAATGAVWASTIIANDTFIIYCNAGDVIAPYCGISNGAAMGSGVFAGALMSS